MICFSLRACQGDEKTAKQSVNQEEKTQETIVEEDAKQEEITEVEETKSILSREVSTIEWE